MGLLVDHQIRALAEKGMIEPFEASAVRRVRNRKVLSFGSTSVGYDMRIATEFKIFTPVSCVVVDPKRMDDRSFVDVRAAEDEHGALYVLIPPNSFLLGRSVERFDLPRDVATVIVGKSTLARCGLIVNITPGEPEWRGHFTIEVSNTTPLPVKLYANEGICQVLFFKTDATCERSYADKDDGKAAKYQNQGPEIVLPRL
mgnify:CR=1 FL=1